MNKNNILLSVIILLLSIIVAVGCRKEEEEPDEADVKITCVPLTGETVDVSSLKVELHKSAKFELPFKTNTSSGSATSSSTTFSAVNNGTYYAVAWDDLDNSGDYNTGDTFGFYDAPIKVDGKKVSITISMYEVQ